MIRTLLKEVKEYKAASIATPFFMILEVLFETLIPFLMASIIDKGVNTGDIHHIYKVGGIMIVAAFCGLLAGMAGGRYGAKASTGFAKNLRNKMFDQIQTYSFANIDHFSTAGLVTRLTTDVTNVQNAYTFWLVVADFVYRYSDVFEYFVKCFSVMSECYGSVMREVLFDQYMTIESAHFRNCEDSDCSEGTCCYRKDFTVCNVSSQYIV